MHTRFYSVAVFSVFSASWYFYCWKSVLCFVLILTILLLLILVNVFFKKAIKTEGTFLSVKLKYRDKRKNSQPEEPLLEMSSLKKLNLSGKQEPFFDGGLLSDYDSRRGRTSTKYGDLPSPVRSLPKCSKLSSDENISFKKTFSPNRIYGLSTSMLSPVRSSVSCVHSSPLRNSKRYNVNFLENREDSFQHDDFPSHSGTCSPGLNSDPPYMASTLPKMPGAIGVGGFSWHSPSVAVLPAVQSPNYDSTTYSTNSESLTPKRNRVKVRLADPNRSDFTSDLCQDMSSNHDETFTTKSVIQVLKEISRKRAFMPSEEDEHQDAKRRSEHALYLSRLEPEEETSIPPRMNGEDDRKRFREPDWDTPNVAGPKRRRKNNYPVNNEILSSLSSSIGLRLATVAPVVEKPKKTVSIGTQVTLLPDTANDTLGGKPAESSKKEVKEAATMPDPPPLPPPKYRSPVKEKTKDLNGILKSALSKFKIQPKDSPSFGPSIKSTNSTLNVNLTSTVTTSTNSEVTKTSNLPVPTSANIPVTAPQPSLTAQSMFTLPTSSVPQSTPGLAVESGSDKQKTSDKTSKPNEMLTFGKQSDDNSKNNASKPELPNFNVKPSDQQKSESLFTFGKPSSPGTSLSQSNIALQSSPNQTISPLQASSKLVTSASANAQNTPPQPNFKLGTPLFSTAQSSADAISPFKVPQTTSPSNSVSFGNANMDSTKNIIPASNSTAQSQSTVVTSNVSVIKDAPKNEPFSFGGSTTNLKEKPVTEEKKESSSTALFSFGKTENKPIAGSEKSDSVNKPFQFGGSAFVFGQAAQTNQATSNTVTQTTTSTPTPASDKPLFTFSANTQKKEVPSGGFTFKLPSSSTSTTSEQKSLFSFSGNATSTTVTSTPAINNAPAVTTEAKAKPLFPPSIFGTSSVSAPVTSSTSLAISNTQATPNTSIQFGSGSAFNNTSTETGKVFSTVTTTSSTPTFGSGTTSTFGGANKSVFGSTATTTANVPPFNAINNNQTGGSSIFGNNTASAASNTSAFSISNTATPTFGSAANNVSTFGNVASGSAPSFAPATTTAASFGNTATPTFGSTASVGATTTGFTAPSGSTAPTFGTAMATTTSSTFGATNTATPSFGSLQTTSSSLFGTATTTTAATAASSTPVLFGSAATSSTPSFGSSSTAAGMPGSTLFGNTSATPAFGTSSTPAFGGNSTTPAPSFGTQSPGFGVQQGSSFGSTPAFGQSASGAFGGQSTFGSQPTAPAFGSTPAFGSGSSAFTATPAPAAPAFGSSTPAFGSSATFGSQDTSKPFTFNAPTSQQPGGAFNFSASQPQPSGSGGLFQFGAASSSAANQPFQFNASQPNSSGFTAGFSPGVGGTGQQMFSIGSGSTAPRRVTTAARRKK